MGISCIYKYNPSFGESNENKKSKSEEMNRPSEEKSLNFIESMIEGDSRNKKNNGDV